MRLLTLSILLALAACSDAPTQPDDAAPPDAAVDAPDDAPTDAAALPTRTETVGGGRMSGGTLVVDVQLGHPTSQAPAAGNGVVFHPATPIQP